MSNDKNMSLADLIKRDKETNKGPAFKPARFGKHTDLKDKTTKFNRRDKLFPAKSANLNHKKGKSLNINEQSAGPAAADFKGRKLMRVRKTKNMIGKPLQEGQRGGRIHEAPKDKMIKVSKLFDRI